MDSFIFALSAVAPIVLAVIVGYFFKKIGMMDEDFAKKYVAVKIKISYVTV